MAVSTVIFFGFVLFCISDVHGDASLSAMETRLLVVEGEILARKRTALNSDITLNNKFEVLKSSLKEELAESFIPPLIKPLVKQAIADILNEDNVGNIISRHVLDEVHNLKASLQNTKTQLIERERDTYRRSLGKLRRRLTKDIRAVQLQLKQTSDDLHDTQQKLNGLKGDFITLNTSYVMVRNEVESCTDGLQEIRLKLPTDFQSTPLNQTNEDDLITLNISGIKKEFKPYEGNESSLASSSAQVAHTLSTTTDPETTAASTDPSQDRTPSTTVQPVTVTSQDPDQHATPSAAAGRDLYDASRHGDLESVRRILSAGRVDINYRGRWWSRTPVMEAAYMGHRDVVEFLVGEGADLSMVDSRGHNVLHLACWEGDLETVKRILSLDIVDINARDNDGHTAADWARGMGHQRVLALLVSRGAH